MRRSKPQRFVSGLGFIGSRAGARSDGARTAQTHCQPVVRACEGRGGHGALRLFEMAKGVVARVTSRIDVCTGLRRRWGRTRHREGKHSETRRAEPWNWNDKARIAQASPLRVRVSDEVRAGLQARYVGS